MKIEDGSGFSGGLDPDPGFPEGWIRVQSISNRTINSYISFLSCIVRERAKLDTKGGQTDSTPVDKHFLTSTTKRRSILS